MAKLLPQQRKDIKRHLKQHFAPAVATNIMRLVENGLCRVTYERGVVKVHSSKDKAQIVQMVLKGTPYDPADDSTVRAEEEIEKDHS